LAFAVGSGLAAGAAILISLDTDITPTMGFGALLLGVVAAIVGGVGSMPGAMLGLLVGLAQHLGVWKLPTQWQDEIVFLILIAFLIARPQGLFGRPVKNIGV
jgi:branched-chain amino acid transport system permease protein